jgi:hypothetical protein
VWIYVAEAWIWMRVDGYVDAWMRVDACTEELLEAAEEL